jgi:hypothetical protein
MPKIEEHREEDRVQQDSLLVRFIKHIQHPDDDSLAANTSIASVLAIPMAEEDTIGVECKAIINHQIDKAKLYKETLPTKLGFAKATIREGVITSVTIMDCGHGYKQIPEVIVTDIKGTGAKLSAEIGIIYTSRFLLWRTGKQRIVKHVIVDNGGKDYTQDATIEIRGSGQGARAGLEISGVLDNIIIEDNGAGYTFPPSIKIEDGGGTGAITMAKINHLGQLESVAILAGGRGYKTSPSVIIDMEIREIYDKRLTAFIKSFHLLSDQLLHDIRMNNLSIDAMNADNVKNVGLGLIQSMGTNLGNAENP